MSGLFRMANASHRLNVGKGDMVIISASSIPGNERQRGPHHQPAVSERGVGGV